jgi:hypothetical protein
MSQAGLTVSAWYGGHLVYHHGMRVRGTALAGSPEDARLPGDERLAEALASGAGDEACRSVIIHERRTRATIEHFPCRTVAAE